MKKECLHNFRSVYYGSEWEVECSKCNKSAWNLYKNEDANIIANQLIER